jgi:hypothetical protein
MMQPFKPSYQAIMGKSVTSTVDAMTPENPLDNDSSQHIKTYMADFMHAFNLKDIDGMAHAFTQAFDALEMMPHKEISHSPEDNL